MAKCKCEKLKKEIEEVEVCEVGAAPFVKWVGGKRGVIAELLKRLPAEFKEYWEPFVGGGAYFFAIHDQLRQAHLSDMNFDLIVTYQMIKKYPKDVLLILEEHSQKHSEEYYYKIRDQHDLKDPIKIAARLIYLNRTCYNGLYRTNKKGQFNVPFGRYTNPDIIRRDQIMACHKALQKATIEFRDFTNIAPQQGDFVYFDPPYHPTNDTSFTTYTKGDFTEQDQIRLHDKIEDLHKKGIKVMLSNSDTSFIRELYKRNIFKVSFISAPRNVNCKADKRNPAQEVLITNY